MQWSIKSQATNLNVNFTLGFMAKLVCPPLWTDLMDCHDVEQTFMVTRWWGQLVLQNQMNRDLCLQNVWWLLNVKLSLERLRLWPLSNLHLLHGQSQPFISMHGDVKGSHVGMTHCYWSMLGAYKHKVSQTFSFSRQDPLYPNLWCSWLFI